MILKTKTLTFLFLPFFLTLHAVQEKEIFDTIGLFQEEEEIPAVVAIGIRKVEGQLRERIYPVGKISLKSNIEVNRETFFQIGPLTQIVTATLLACLVQDGQIELTDPISKFLPQSMKLPSYQGQEITLRDLATHTSGLPDLKGGASRGAPFSSFFRERLLANYLLSRPPGSKYESSNFGYALLSHLLTRISNHQTPSKLLIRALGMNETSYTLSKIQKMRRASGYDEKREIPFEDQRKGGSFFEGASGLYSTPSDLLLLLSFLLGLKKTGLNEALPLLKKSYHQFPAFEVGLCFKMTNPLGDEKRIYTISGGGGGYQAYMGLIPSSETGVVILLNREDADPEKLGLKLLSIFQEEP